MSPYPVDRLVFGPDDVDLARSPLAGHLDVETYVLGAFNPALPRLPNGTLAIFVRIAEALRQPVVDGKIHAIRWESVAESPNGANAGGSGRYVLDPWPIE